MNIVVICLLGILCQSRDPLDAQHHVPVITDVGVLRYQIFNNIKCN